MEDGARQCASALSPSSIFHPPSSYSFLPERTAIMWQLHDVKWWEFIVRASVVYLVVMALRRLAGKRQVGQMGMPQIVALLLISNAVQNAMNGNDGSITGGIILAGVIMFWSYLFELVTSRSKKFENIVQGRPTVLIRNGKLLREHLRHERLSPTELKVILRKQ